MAESAAVFARYRVLRPFGGFAQGAVVAVADLGMADRKVQQLTEQRWLEPVSDDEMPDAGPRNTATRRRKTLTT